MIAEDGSVAGATLTIDAMLNGPCTNEEDGMLNNNSIKLNAVPRLGSMGAGAGEECARRSKVVHQQ